MASVAAGASAAKARPTTVTLAVLLIVFTQLASIPFFFAPGADEIPAAVGVLFAVAGVLTLVGAWGMWRLRRWGAILAFVLTLLNVLASIPGYFDPPSGWILFELWTLGPLTVLALILILLPGSRQAYRS